MIWVEFSFSNMPLGIRFRKVLVIIAGLFLVVCVAFLDVQMHFKDSVILEKADPDSWNASTKHRTLMQRQVKKEWWPRPQELFPVIENDNKLLDFLESDKW